MLSQVLSVDLVNANIVSEELLNRQGAIMPTLESYVFWLTTKGPTYMNLTSFMTNNGSNNTGKKKRW
jgi:hypothetical protein